MAATTKYVLATSDEDDVEVASELQTQDSSSYRTGKRTLGLALVLGVVGVLGVMAMRGATWQQKTSDVDAITALDEVSDAGDSPGVCSADHMGRVKQAMDKVKHQLTKGVMDKDKVLWKKWFGEEPDHKDFTDEAVQKILMNAFSHMYDKFAAKLPESRQMGKKAVWHFKISKKWQTVDDLDGSWPWTPRCCGQTKKAQFHCDGVCDANYFFMWGKHFDYPGAVHICPKAWTLDDEALGAGLFHNAIHLAGGGDNMVAHGMGWSKWIAKEAPLQARHSAMNYMLYVVENGMGEAEFKKVSEKWYSLFTGGSFSKWQKDSKAKPKDHDHKDSKDSEDSKDSK